MTSTTTAPRQRAFDPDDYLDCRQPGWEVYEDRGLVRFERQLGAKKALVFVDDNCPEVLETLRARESSDRNPTVIPARLVRRDSAG